MTHINFIYMYCESHHLYLIAVETGNIPATNHVKFWFIIYHWTTVEPWNSDNSNSRLTRTEFPFPWTEIYLDNLNSLLTQTVFRFPSEFEFPGFYCTFNFNSQLILLCTTFMKFIKMSPTWNVKIMSIKILKMMPQQQLNDHSLYHIQAEAFGPRENHFQCLD